MSIDKIRCALESHAASMPGALPIAGQNFAFPAEGQQLPDRYMEFRLLPARNYSPGLRQASTLHRGIFQINLAYPAAIGTRQIEQMAAQIQARFWSPRVEPEFDGVAVRITEKPDVGAPLDHRPGYYVIPVSISYESYF
ncbi:phage tail terminator-like protein [Massilia sp. METH4]|uniref:phage tail terminator-like protein n=1 Tax=Massilia sp. METH4 TaxID=3123041 RepID=UPI0030CE7ED1